MNGLELGTKPITNHPVIKESKLYFLYEGSSSPSTIHSTQSIKEIQFKLNFFLIAFISFIIDEMEGIKKYYNSTRV